MCACPVRMPPTPPSPPSRSYTMIVPEQPSLVWEDPVLSQIDPSWSQKTCLVKEHSNLAFERIYWGFRSADRKRRRVPSDILPRLRPPRNGGVTSPKYRSKVTGPQSAPITGRNFLPRPSLPLSAQNRPCLPWSAPLPRANFNWVVLTYKKKTGEKRETFPCHIQTDEQTIVLFYIV